MSAVNLDYVLRLRTREAQANTEALDADVKELNQDLKRTETQAGRSGVSVGRMGRGMSKMGRAVGSAGGEVGRLAGVLGRVSPGLAEAAMLTADMADAAEVSQKGIKGLGISASTAVVAIAALGTAAVVVANHTADARAELKKYQGIINDTTASTRSLINAQNALKLATGDVAGFIGDLQIQTALLNGEIDEADVVAGELGGTIADKLKPALMAAGQAYAENESRIQALTAVLSSGKTTLQEYKAAQEGLADARAARPELLANIEAIKGQADKARDAINGYADALNAAADAGSSSGGTGSGTGAKTKAPITGTIGDTQSLLDQLAAIDASMAATFGLQSAEEFAQTIGAGMEEAGLRVARDLRRLERTQTAASVLGTGGDPLALLGMAGPYGAAASTALGGLAQLGGMSDEDLDAMFSGLADDILGGIERLPELLVQLIPEFAVTLATELPAALGTMLNELIVAMAKAIGDALNPTKGDNFLDKITGGLEEGVENLLNWDGEIMIREGGLFGGSRASGGTIPRDGMYLLHAGEEILRSNGVGTNGSMSGGMREMLLRLQMTTPGMLPTVQALDIATGPGGPWEGT